MDPAFVAEHNRLAAEARAEAYRAEADPLFFKWQRGEATEQDWLDVVKAIRAKSPYFEATVTPISDQGDS